MTILDYIDADYSAAINDEGLIISHFEYEEMQQFVNQDLPSLFKNIDKAASNSLTKNSYKFLDDLKVL